MTVTEKKNEVLTTLSSTTDATLIDEVYELIHFNTMAEEINITELPSTLQQKIAKAIDDYKTGNYITHNEMKLKVEQWLIK